MSVKILCRNVNIGAAANIGGPVETRHVQFTIEAPELEAWLKKQDPWTSREIIGALYEPEPTDAVRD